MAPAWKRAARRDVKAAMECAALASSLGAAESPHATTSAGIKDTLRRILNELQKMLDSSA